MRPVLIDDARGQGRRGEGTVAIRGHQPDAGDGERPASLLGHASFFSGCGGLDLGFEAAGWRTLSFSEIDPYASAVLATQWPDVPNLGDIVALARRHQLRPDGESLDGPARIEGGDAGDWTRATVWSGGFPCQDLSIAGKRKGFGGERSVLAFSFLELVERYRPEWFLLENVPGLLSSHGGADLAALYCAVGDLGYGMAHRVLDARHYHVAQRRRRVFMLATRTPAGRAGAERAAKVLALAASRRWHPEPCNEAGQDAAAAPPASAGTIGIDFVGTLPAGTHGFPDGIQEFLQGHFQVVDRPTPDPDRGRAPDGLARQPHDRPELEAFVKVARPRGADGLGERWDESAVSPTLNLFDASSSRAVTLVTGGAETPDSLPEGLDSHRYRVIGNGVVAPVAYAIAAALREELDA